MICRSCLRRAAGASIFRSIASRAPFSTSLRLRNAAPTPAAAAPATLTPLIDGAAGPATPEEAKQPLSSCPAGTVLVGLNYIKGQSDPVALPDEDYPAWLWKCLEVQKKTDTAADAEAGDEFSKSRKQRRLAAKRKEQIEAKLLASGNLEALVPKVPLPAQSINLPGEGKGGLDDAVVAHEKREELRKALRKDRKAKIKESNYLKTM
ncbi:mitochondrial ribosomal protein L37-domain-containing protein [Podospora aff. communis PSN243]|uniref:Large ribosomal subunit protein mL54 n=1 Tax=Podospora aff. communis PSN243 TaxID=3040156 RepID=A0AAV9H5D9_9PEZI|nr:mitochondrial ribosomal protein L37-domain-containing protein [Podospora aff. communis PSN243]